MKEYDPTTSKKGQQISLKIKRLGINGEGIGYYKKLIIFVPGALPKEEVTATITNVTPKFAEGTLQSVKKPLKIAWSLLVLSMKHVAFANYNI